jgi:hypothetical protein
MAKTENKYPTNAGYITKPKDGGDAYVSLNKELTLVVGGKKLSAKSMRIVKTFEVYDKDTQTSHEIGKLVETDKSRFIKLNDSVGFIKDGETLTPGVLFVSSKQREKDNIDSLVEKGKMAADKAEEIKNGMFFLEKLTLPTPKE